MPEITEDVTALEDLPETGLVELAGHGGGGAECQIITCLVTCVLTIL